MDTASRPRQRITAHLLLVLFSASAGVLALYLALLAKLALADLPGGTWSAESRPRGMGRLAVFIPLLLIALVLLWGWYRRSRPGGRSPGAARAVAVLVALAALAPGWLGFSWMRGPQMDLFGWQTPEGPTAGKPLGSWAADPTSGDVVRVRADGVTAYNGEGRHGWDLRAPDGGAVCAMSKDSPSGVGLLTLSTAQGACGSRLMALDLSGKERWTKDIPNLVGEPSAAGSLAVAATADSVLAHDLRTGAELWRYPLPAGTVVPEVAAGPDRVLFLARTDQGSELFALDARTGSRSWQSPLPAGHGSPGIVSASPAAAVADGRLLLFDDAGRPRAGSQPSHVPATDGARLVVGDVL
ncbi:PQQ-binding-like beta-propeller repeat protein [Streptomyces sp. NPDC050448]|uniref:outer membrane protein assembly factor BamB family protein n=1 Tax=Streptomyces sp. NPDC050448 TaxID=3155404 RepID=UPI003449F4A4